MCRWFYDTIEKPETTIATHHHPIAESGKLQELGGGSGTFAPRGYEMMPRFMVLSS